MEQPTQELLAHLREMDELAREISESHERKRQARLARLAGRQRAGGGDVTAGQLVCDRLPVAEQPNGPIVRNSRGKFFVAVLNAEGAVIDTRWAKNPGLSEGLYVLLPCERGYTAEEVRDGWGQQFLGLVPCPI